MAILRHFLIFAIHQLTHREQLFWGQDWGQVDGSSNKLSIIKETIYFSKMVLEDMPMLLPLYLI